MPNKKLTDNEIIKALECCPRGIGMKCEKCPMFRTNDCMSKLHVNTLDLINRQKAEIERLKCNEKLESVNITLNALIEMKNSTINNLMKTVDMLETQLKTAKAEAVKEFAEKLKEFMHNKFKALDEYEFEYISERDIDNLAKEMVGDDNA